MQAQTDQKFRVLIIDDNSIDNTVEIASHFIKDLRLQIRIKEKTAAKGAAESLNIAFGSIKTPYFALIDSDAYLAKNWLEEMRRMIDGGAQIAVGPILAHKQKSVIGYLAGLELESRYLRLRHKQEVLYLSTCDLMGRTELLRGVRLDSNLRYGYDHQFSYLLNQKGVEFTFNARTHCYHHNKSSLATYIKQQFQIGYHQLRLSLKYPREASKKDDISYWHLPFQPILFLMAIIFFAIDYRISLIILAIIILLNYYLLSYLIFKKKWALLPGAFLLILVRVIVWIVAIFIGIFSFIFLR